MAEDSNDKVWHLDKRVSLAHLGMTITVVAGMVAGYVKMESQVAQNATRIQRLEMKDQTHADQVTRKLDRIEDKLDRHIQYHMEESGWHSGRSTAEDR